MKQRIISGIVIALITIACVYYGGYLLQAMCLFIGLFGSYEINKCIRKNFDFLLYLVEVVATLSIYFFFDYSLVVILFETLFLFLISVFDEKRTINDLALIELMSIVIGCSIYFLKTIDEISVWFLGYIIIIAYITDVFAYFIGMRFGKHKLNEKVSPNKTVEGAIGGFVCGAIISIIWSMFFNFYGYEPYIIIIVSICLPIISQIGDLAYSLLKRHYEIKDFSKLIPGHGGLLDRLDSLTFCLCFVGSLLLLVG